MSLENALVIRNPDIVTAYVWEYSHVFALSEPLDWEQDWVAPEYRLGT
jgi:phosphatidylserine/phosphatidylglycerophosphate/cardiolipin synthase-like enzyme